MIEAGDLRPGNTVERGGQLYMVLDFSHIKMGRGTAIVRAKLRNIDTGSVTEETFRPEEKFSRARIERREAQYLYKDGDNYVVMDTQTYDQSPISAETLGDALRFLKENDNLFLMQYEGRIIGVELPIADELEITYTEPGFKGDTATGGTKPAELETGLTVQVPLFVTTGETIRVKTETGTYVERVG